MKARVGAMSKAGSSGQLWLRMGGAYWSQLAADCCTFRRSLGLPGRTRPASMRLTTSIRIYFTLVAPLLCFCYSTGHAADKYAGGREIFRRNCAKCHGKEGEGVMGKFEGPLQGERSVEKLTRYIQRNMPDDNPGKLSQSDSAAVAAYIYDAFYSREARLRKHPVRIELARLTNRQYLNSVADLLKEFTGKEATLSAERGLQGIYYNSRDFGKKIIE